MGVTISTHNGSKVAREHNIRNPKVVGKEEHIDLNKPHEIWIDEKPKMAYQRLFGQAIEEYNANQKRSDRRITDYYQQICDDKKKHPVYEMIVGIGDRTDYAEGVLSENIAKSILREFVDNWEERNPHLVLIGAYYHADEEGIPHVHLDYIPVATGYQKGLKTQSALVKALGQQGFNKDGKETAQIQWERKENAYLESLCQNAEIEVIHPRKEGREHLDTTVYKAQQKLIETKVELQNAEQEKEQLSQQIRTTKRKIAELNGKVMTLEEVKAVQGKKSITGSLKNVSYEDYVSLKRTALSVKKVGKENNELKQQVQALQEENKRLTENANRLSTKRMIEHKQVLDEKDRQIREQREKTDKYLRELIFIKENLSEYAKKEFQNLAKEFNCQEEQQSNLAHQRKRNFSL